MKIINHGRLPIKEWRGTCGVCGADVIWDQSEGVWGDDQRDGEYCHISCPTEGCTSKIYGNKEQQGMSEMPEYVLKDIAKKAVGELVAELEQKARELDVAYAEVERYANLYAKSQAEARELDAANEEIETLRMVVNQAIDFAGIRMEHQNWMHCNESSTYTANAWPELAAYLRERETKEGSV